MAQRWQSLLQISRGVKGGRWITRDGQSANADELTAGDIAALYGLPDDGEDGDLGEYDLMIRRRAPAPAHLPALSGRQADTLKAIETLTTERGYAPTVRELCRRLDVRSSCTVQRHIEALIRKGYVARRKAGASRALVVLHCTDLNKEAMARIRGQEAATAEMVEAGRTHG